MVMVLLFCGVVFPAHAASTTHYVRASATGSNTGTSWTDAYTSLQSALTASISGDTIWVAAGTYRPSSTGDRNATFTLKSGVAVYGGFAGTETTLEARSWTSNVTTLSGDLDGDDGANFANNTENSYHVVTGAIDAILDGFTITGGNANGSNPNNRGGGLYSQSTNTVLRNLIIAGNAASQGGGAYLAQGSPSLTAITFSGNTASASGGGLYTNGSSATLGSVTFTSNTAQNGNGGGLYSTGGSTTLSSATFTGNTATGNAGALYSTSTRTTLNSSTFTGNSALGSAGALHNVNSTTVLTGTTFSNNTAQVDGGAIANNVTATLYVFGSTLSSNSGRYGGGINNLGKLTLTDSTLSANTAVNGGGAINSANATGALTITGSLLRDNIVSSGGTFGTGGGLQTDAGVATVINTTFSGNQANGTQDAGGGGIIVYSGALTLTNVTIADNSTTSAGSASDTGGGGISVNTGATVTVANTLVAGNSSAVGRPDLSGTLVSAGYNLIGDATGSTGVTNGANGDLAGTTAAPLDPKLGSLAENGGPTQTRALLEGSPAIDAGGTPCPATDQRGSVRTTPCDIGAYEFGTPMPVNQVPTLDSLADLSVLEDAGPQTVSLFGIGSGAGESQTLTVSATSSNPALVPSPTVSYTSPSATGSLTITPAANANGSATISVVVRDSGGTANGGMDTLTRTFTVQVTPVNDAPDFTTGPNQTVASGTGAQTVVGWASGFSGGPADEASQTVLAYSVISNSAPELFVVAPVIDTSGTLTYTPRTGASGTATIGVTVRDSGGTASGGVDSSAVRTFTITVTTTPGSHTFMVYLPLVNRSR